MNPGTEKRRRRSIRLRAYDYTQTGAYFITIVAQGRAMLFGDIAGGEARFTDFGRIVEIALDAFVVMPNHVHGIVNIIASPVGATSRSPLRNGPPPRSLGAFVGGFKSAVTQRINELRHTPAAPVWQRNYYEHVVRDDGELLRVREYIQNNPLEWENDRENPSRPADWKPSRAIEPWQV
jgi:putative transposase